MKSSHGAVLRSLLLSSLPMALGACTMVGSGVQPAPGPPPLMLGPATAAEPAPAGEVDERREAITARVVDVALAAIGTPYQWGGTDVNGFDCSGLIRFAYGRLGIALPRTSTAQIRAGSPVAPEPARLRSGDVLGFSGDGSGKTDHVGLYIGADEFIHSSSSGVRISTLRNPYWQQSLVAARRFVD
jgi:cell wall-associated NlpC family hydrolase